MNTLFIQNVVSMDIRCKPGMGCFNMPLLLSFCNHPIFGFLPCYTVDDHVVPNVRFLYTVSISDRSMNYFVGAMDNHNKENSLFYLGKTTLTKTKNSIVFDPSLFPSEFTDVVFIPEKVFYELATSSLCHIFKIQKYEEYPTDDVTFIDVDNNSVSVYNLKEEDIVQENFPKRLYLNEHRWRLFFSSIFQQLTMISFLGIPFKETKCIEYDRSFNKGESIQFTLPSYKTIKDEQNKLLCKYIYENLFKKENDQILDKAPIQQLTITAVLREYGWIHILHMIES